MFIKGLVKILLVPKQWRDWRAVFVLVQVSLNNLQAEEIENSMYQSYVWNDGQSQAVVVRPQQQHCYDMDCFHIEGNKDEPVVSKHMEQGLMVQQGRK